MAEKPYCVWKWLKKVSFYNFANRKNGQFGDFEDIEAACQTVLPERSEVN